VYARLYPLLLAAASAAVLGAALVAQFGFGFEPCHLCILQRIPYGFAAVFAMLAALETDRRLRALLLGACALAFFTDAGLAFYHVGVEKHWWESACSGSESLAKSASGLLAKLAQGKAAPACDSVPFALFGFSMAFMNLIAALALAQLAAFWAFFAWWTE